MATDQQIIKQVKLILAGIDETETDSEYGWWETSAGADFGLEKLNSIIKLIGENYGNEASECSAKKVDG